MERKTRTQVNTLIAEYWASYKARTRFKKVKKNKVPSFTRHNGTRLVRLRDSGWRYPKSCQGNRGSITKPSIGYKRPDSTRFTIPAYGLVPQVVRTAVQLEVAVNSHKLPVIAHVVGTKKRIQLLQLATRQGWPLMLRR